MPTVADCLRQHGETFLQRLQKNSDKISLQQRKVLSAITRCRTSTRRPAQRRQRHGQPKSFLKVRYYGWMASNSDTTRDRVKWLAWLNTPQIIWTADEAQENTTGERLGVSPPWKPPIDDHFQNTHQAVSDRGARRP